MSNKTLNEFANEETGPVFYEPQEVIKLQRWLNRAAIAVVIMTIVSGFVGFPTIYHSTYPFFPSTSQNDTAWNVGAIVLAFVLVVIGAAFQSILGYFALKTLGFILKILMEMEFNARGAK